jgi:hypothetical protein
LVEVSTRRRDPQQVPEIGTAPSGWRNWQAHTAAADLRGRAEYALYSDAHFTSELREVGPYTLLNTVAGTGTPRAGLVTQALVLRVEYHLPG